MKRFTILVGLVASLGASVASSPVPAQQTPAKRPAAAEASGPARTNVPYSDAKPILDALREDLLPAELRTGTPAQRQAAWPRFLTRRDAEIRARVVGGDEESIVNFLMFGTSFTNVPRVTARDMAAVGQAKAADIIVGRISNLVAALASPGTDERLRFVRTVVERRGINPVTAAGKEAARGYLVGILKRVTEDVEGYTLAAQSFQQRGDSQGWEALAASFFHKRGLGTDTSVLSDFAIGQALAAMHDRGLLAASGVRRVAIVGPGLDFTDQEAGYDFYPPQMLQPFAVIDSLIRLGLAVADDLRVTTLDLNPRINAHLDAARQRARAGDAYVLQLARDADDTWKPPVLAYWERFGDQIGEAVAPLAAPEVFGNVRTRAVSVRPQVVLSITPRDVNIVSQRLDVAASDQRWDVIIATSVLAYYDVFEQSLAMTNLSRMLRPGGLLLSSDLISALPTTSLRLIGRTDVPYTETKSDRVVWYQQQ
jgi:hypothetical protein